MRQVIHIPDSNTRVINHLKSQSNMSAYVVTLIEKDMENPPLTREEIIGLIKEHGSASDYSNYYILDSINSTMELL